MGLPLRALIVEDNPDDAALIERKLRRAGFDVEARRVESHSQTSDALNNAEWDVVLADFTLPGFGGLDALAMLVERGLDSPFIIVSGTIDVATALEAMKAGAADYVLKNELERLPSVVQRELEAADVRRERRSAEAERDSALLALRKANEELLQLAAENARIYEAEHRIAETLQEAFLDLPHDLPEIDYYVRYVSAAEYARVGGDFYDLFSLGAGKVAVVVGDVSGKGLDAASLTGMVRNVIRAAALDGVSPAEIISKANEVVFRFTQPEKFVTLFFGELDTSTGELRFVSAGHPAALIRRAEGGVDELEATSPIVGAFSASVFTEGEATLDRSDVLFLYTDGLTEARKESGEFYGQKRLRTMIAGLAPPLDPETLVDAVFDDVIGFTQTRPNDDMALLAARLIR